ncbi:MAG: hypothetical protein M3O20_01745 [Acidobacteriota bacterium]|jgi:hypothetical protein|nr:hypothetical protein [Acidobacteriota bacterium]
MDARRILFSIFERVADEILKHLLEMRFGRIHFRKWIVSPHGFSEAGKRELLYRVPCYP